VQLYAGSTRDFIRDTIQQDIAKKLGDAYFEYFRFRASASEFNSWQNSLVALTAHLQYANLMDNGIALELRLPLTSARLDALLTGHDDGARSKAVIVELKQWSSVQPSEIDDCVVTHLGGRLRDVPHPSLQAANYREYLADMNSSFYDSADAVGLEACAWLHNLQPESYDRLSGAEFAHLIDRAPLFGGRNVMDFQSFLHTRLGGGGGMEVLKRVSAGKYAPSKGLMSHAAAVIKGEPTYTLLDDQIVAFNLIRGLAQKGLHARAQHTVVVVKGGPGTGKSVLALNVMAQLLQEGKNVQHATGSRAFTGSLRRKLGTRVRPLLQYFNSYGQADRGEIDVLIMDEAHRIRETSNSRFTKSAKRSDRAQVDELIDAARVAVFFVDDHQSVRPGEIGSSQLIREAAVRFDAKYLEAQLETQFRCAGSDRYVDWLDQLLAIRKTGTSHLGAIEDFDFQIVSSPAEIERMLREKAALGYSARMTAGFCWPWSDPRDDGTLEDDVVIGDYRRPWNAKPEAARLARGIPKADVWATDPKGLEQVGCVYTAQGFEFDYVGVIWGRDLVHRAGDGEWSGQTAMSHDRVVRTRAKARFTDCVKNAYRVLMTRGMKGCYVHFIDDETERFVREHM
jgi:hypothetical protein